MLRVSPPLRVAVRQVASEGTTPSYEGEEPYIILQYIHIHTYYMYIYIYIHIQGEVPSRRRPGGRQGEPLQVYGQFSKVRRSEPRRSEGGGWSGRGGESKSPYCYGYGQFSNVHVCFCGLDPGNLNFETVRTNRQHICF